MKRIVFIVLFLSISSMPAQAQLFRKGFKIGYVDIARIFDQYQKTDIATEKLKKEIEEKRKVIEKRKENINLLKEKLKSQAVVISEEEKSRMEEEVEAKVKELKDIAEKSNRDLRQKEQELVRDILKDIEETIKIYGKDNGYDFILDKREVLYGSEAMDLTEEIINIINKKLHNKGG